MKKQKTIEARRNSKRGNLIHAFMEADNDQIEKYIEEYSVRLFDWVAKDFGLKPHLYDDKPFGRMIEAMESVDKSSVTVEWY